MSVRLRCKGDSPEEIAQDLRTIGTELRTLASAAASGEGAISDVAAGLTEGILTDGTAGYIDLTTNSVSGWDLNTLRSGAFAIVCIASLYWDETLNSIVFSASTGEGNLCELYFSDDDDKLLLLWDGTEDIVTSGLLTKLGMPRVFTMVFTDSNVYFYDNTTLRDTEAYNTLATVNATTIRLGVDRSGANFSKGLFGGFFVLDLTDGALTVDAAFAASLASAVHAACTANQWDPDDVRTAIRGVSTAIDGTYWKLDELGTSEPEEVIGDGTTIKRYLVSDGTVDSASGGKTSNGAVRGAIISNGIDTSHAVGELANKINDILAALRAQDIIEE